MKRFDKKINVWIDGELLQFIRERSNLKRLTWSDVIRKMLICGMDKMRIEN